MLCMSVIKIVCVYDALGSFAGRIDKDSLCGAVCVYDALG